jgi:hypothetical protein
MNTRKRTQRPSGPVVGGIRPVSRSRHGHTPRSRRPRTSFRRMMIIFSVLAIAIGGFTILQWQVFSRGSHVGATTTSLTGPAGHANGVSADSRGSRRTGPPAPTGLTADAVRPRRVNLSWRADPRSAAVARYYIYRDGIDIGTSRIARFADVGVKPATAYSYRIRARNRAGRFGAASKVVSVSTPQAASSPSPTSSPPSTPGSSPTPIPSSSSGPPSGFPDATNTGYENAPGYPGSLKDCNSVVIRSNTTYQFCDFSHGLTVGSAGYHPTNVTFIGCRFASNLVNDANVADYGARIVFSYDTFEPSTVPSGPGPTSPATAAIANGLGYQYGIDQRYAGALTVDHADFWGFEEAIQIADSSMAAPVVVSNSWIHNPRSPGSSDHTDGILENYGGLSYMVFDHNSIVGDGNTNALALQGAAGYSHITISNNYFSGYGYMVNSGADTKSSDMVFTGNVWGTDIEPIFGPLYGNAMYVTPGLGSVWSGNRIYVKPGTTWMAEGNNGLFWWPGDGNPSSPRQIVGHRSDYRGP